jgi:large subunit ribosomal protein L31
MAQKVDQKFYNEAITKCSNCGSTYVFGLAQETMSIEVCGNCHPFYTGKETRIDTAGRIEKFLARQGKLQITEQTDKKVRDRKNKQFLGDLAPTEVEQPAPKPVAKAKKTEPAKAMQETPISKEVEQPQETIA